MSHPLLGPIGRVAVGSTNPVKIAAARVVLASFVPDATVTGVPVASGVRVQPWGDPETVRGAETRARAALSTLDADLGIGIEGGVVEDDGGVLRTCAWAVVVSRDGRSSVGGSLAMPLPAAVARLVRDGVELGHAMDAVSGGRDTKHGAGAVGILTAGRIDRQRAYEAIITYAMAPWFASEYWTA